MMALADASAKKLNDLLMEGTARHSLLWHEVNRKCFYLATHDFAIFLAPLRRDGIEVLIYKDNVGCILDIPRTDFKLLYHKVENQVHRMRLSANCPSTRVEMHEPKNIRTREEDQRKVKNLIDVLHQP